MGGGESWRDVFSVWKCRVLQVSFTKQQELHVQRLRSWLIINKEELQSSTQVSSNAKLSSSYFFVQIISTFYQNYVEFQELYWHYDFFQVPTENPVLVEIVF